MFNFLKPKVEIKYETRTVEKDISESDLMIRFAEHFGDIGDYQIDKEEEKRMFEELRSVDYLQPYLRAQIARDMQLYFAATTDLQRELIKGRIARTAFLRSRLAQETQPEEVTTKMKGLRYGK
jgi:hypothetical protein